MLIRTLQLFHFRSYIQGSVSFSPGFNAIVGPNGSGKTSVLEAIHLFIAGRSFRTHQQRDLIRYQQESFKLDLNFSKHGVDQYLSTHQSMEMKNYWYDQTSINSFTRLVGTLQGVTMSPDDMLLIKGSPDCRRQYLDLQIVQVDPLYLHFLLRYRRSIRQRNALLKSKSRESIELWEWELAHSAAYLISQRREAVKVLEKEARQIYALLSPQAEELTLKYKSSCLSQGSLKDMAQEIFERYRDSRSKECELGYTTQGPHREDLIFFLDQQDVRHFSSEGQQRSVVVALRLAEWKRLSQESGEDPLLLMDEMGLGLDPKRRQSLVDIVKNKGQIIVTTTHLDSMLQEEDIHIINMSCH